MSLWKCNTGLGFGGREGGGAMRALRAVEEATTQKIIGVQEQLELLKKACKAARFYSTPYVQLVCILVCDVFCLFQK